MRIAKILTGLLMVMGIIMLIGTVGKSDYMAATHQYYSEGDLIKDLLAGGLLLVPYTVIKKISKS